MLARICIILSAAVIIGAYVFTRDPPVSSVTYSCGRFGEIKAVFSEGRAILAFRMGSVVLPQVASASGAKYEGTIAGSVVVFWDKGTEAVVSMGGESIACRKAG